VNADELSVYNSFLSAGTALNTGSANSMMVLDDGVMSMWTNPGGLITEHHQIYAGSILTSAYATQSRVSSSDYKAGLGMFGYLYSLKNSAFGLGFIGRNVEESSAKYSRVGETRNSISYSEITMSYAHILGDGYSLGVSAGPILGRARDGVLVNESDHDTLYTPLLWFARFGIKKSMGNWRWGLALEAPATGKVTVEQPVNLGSLRNKNDVDYSGAMGLRAGIGWGTDIAGVEADLLYFRTDMIQVDGNATEFTTNLMSAGIAGHLRFNELVSLRSGIRFRFSDPEELTFIQIGTGGSYILSPELTAYVSGGMLLHTGDEITQTVYDDVVPFILRAGVIFHNEPE
jgi:hypothetical protein